MLGIGNGQDRLDDVAGDVSDLDGPRTAQLIQLLWRGLLTQRRVDLDGVLDAYATGGLNIPEDDRVGHFLAGFGFAAGLLGGLAAAVEAAGTTDAAGFGVASL